MTPDVHGGMWNSGGVRPRAERLTDLGALPGPIAADSRAAPDGTAAGSLTALRERLRNLAPSHASAIRREAPTSDRGQAATDSPSPHRGDSPQGNDEVGWRRFDTLTRRFWDQADHFRSWWTAHLERWPRPRAREHPRLGDPPGSWRGPGDRTLSCDQNAQAGQVIELLQECEPTVTDVLRRLESESPSGARLVGLEHRLKGPDRLKEKLVDTLRAEDMSDVIEASSRHLRRCPVHLLLRCRSGMRRVTLICMRGSNRSGIR